ncbi:hypothetical protein BX600DRAFT_440175 [Xylariales sp. PMI_506]|nr:hypothetical protein BX600DRAFT_440175 [Xylariales sp. PMI_506]
MVADMPDHDEGYVEGPYVVDTQQIGFNDIEEEVFYGRKFSGLRRGGNSSRLLFPTDEKSKVRHELQHRAWYEALGRGLHLAPISHVQNVLNVETGCGTWAIEFAEEHPFTSVIGVDHSYMQGAWVPPNCELVLDDIGLRHWGWECRLISFSLEGLVVV